MPRLICVAEIAITYLESFYLGFDGAAIDMSHATAVNDVV